jgi:hypothetical protein
MQLQQSIQNLASRPEEGTCFLQCTSSHFFRTLVLEAYIITNPLEQFTWLSRDHLNVLVYLVCSSVEQRDRYHRTLSTLVNGFPLHAIGSIGESAQIC